MGRSRACDVTTDAWGEIDEIVAAALDRPEHDRMSYVRSACAGRPDLASEVESLLADHESPGPLDALSAEALEERAFAGRRLGPYRLVKVIGRGGMGSVWLAERDDAQFQKQVAVKMLAAGLPVSEALRRFREERQILASLEHPHIARLLDAGRTPDGLNYIVMEYVDGVSVTQYCDAHRLSVRERVGLLRTICSTVHFAHQRLVVHRDLKPANILVTANGEPKLLDFGVAKMLAPAAAAAARTVPQLRLFTPAYASPEQRRGAPTTTSSDVYSLGVLAYELLTGCNPYRPADGSAEDVFEAASGRDPDRPSVVVRQSANPAARRIAEQVDGDLDAIVLKAMRLAPEDRYRSADELADDLKRYLSGQPVDARRGTLAYRARKFARRHRPGVAAAAVAAALAVGGITAVMWQARVASRERAVAQRRFNDVRRLARAMMFDLYDRIAPLPGSTSARQALVTESLHYLDQLRREVADDRDLALEVAEAYTRVGEVQGSPALANLGDTAGALASYRSAQAILEAELAREPGAIRARRMLGRVHGLTGHLLLYLRREDEALRAVQAGVRLSRELAATGNEDDRRDLAGAYHRLADVLGNTDRAASLVPRRQAIELFEAQLAAHPGDPSAQRNVALGYKVLGSTLLDMKRGDEAEPALLKALALDQHRVRADPNSALARLDLSFDSSLLGSLLWDRGELNTALSYFERTIEERRKLVEADPKDARARGRLAYAYLQSGEIRIAAGDPRHALEALRAALELSEGLVSANADDRISREYSAEALTKIGAAERMLAASKSGVEGRALRAHACAAFERAQTLYAKNGVATARGDKDKEDRENATLADRQVAECRSSGQLARADQGKAHR
jgi:tetratricopeptide (TPR) repeat protein